ncbi:MAG: GntR family transcriptional regulator [Verrucomicrobia bacterium]|nr:GntR family transcriptional regulator [Verrucomicrobiota bacterium]
MPAPANAIVPATVTRAAPDSLGGVARPKAPPVQSLREFIRDTLLDRIARGELPPGQRVVEFTLVKEFSISATPVREAIRELVAMGVLEAQNNKGASVREVRLDETTEAFEVRAALETLAARQAAPKLEGCCANLRRTAEAIVEAAERRDLAAFQEHNQIFHRTIVEAAGNTVLLKTWDSLFFQVRTRWTMEYLKTFDPVAIAREHLPIADALGSGEAELAATLMASHSCHVVEFLKTEAARRKAATVPSAKP